MDTFSPIDRAAQKQRSREDDRQALLSGQKTREQLCKENGHFVFRNVRISLRGSRPLK